MDQRRRKCDKAEVDAEQERHECVGRASSETAANRKSLPVRG